MSIKMSQVPVEQVFLDIRTSEMTGSYEFTIDCGAVYFGAIYDDDGNLLAVDQYFYSESFSRDDMEAAIDTKDLLFVDDHDFPAKTYLLSKGEAGGEWLRFHAVVPGEINPQYFSQKYIS